METSHLLSEAILSLERQAETLLRRYLFSPENEEDIAQLMSDILAGLMRARGAEAGEIQGRILGLVSGAYKEDAACGGVLGDR